MNEKIIPTEINKIEYIIEHELKHIIDEHINNQLILKYIRNKYDCKEFLEPIRGDFHTAASAIFGYIKYLENKINLEI